MQPDIKFASRVYFWAAVYGVIVLGLAYFQPVPDPWHLTHLGFVGTAMVFQGVFLVIARDPLRFAPLMPVTFFEKLCFGVPAIAFAMRGQVPISSAIFGSIDLLLAALFLFAYLQVRRIA